MANVSPRPLPKAVVDANKAGGKRKKVPTAKADTDQNVSRFFGNRAKEGFEAVEAVLTSKHIAMVGEIAVINAFGVSVVAGWPDKNHKTLVPGASGNLKPKKTLALMYLESPDGKAVMAQREAIKNKAGLTEDDKSLDSAARKRMSRGAALLQSCREVVAKIKACEAAEFSVSLDTDDALIRNNSPIEIVKVETIKVEGGGERTIQIGKHIRLGVKEFKKCIPSAKMKDAEALRKTIAKATTAPSAGQGDANGQLREAVQKAIKTGGPKQVQGLLDILAGFFEPDNYSIARKLHGNADIRTAAQRLLTPLGLIVGLDNETQAGIEKAIASDGDAAKAEGQQATG